MQIVECVILLSFLWRKIPSSICMIPCFSVFNYLVGSFSSAGRAWSDNAKAVSSILTRTIILVSPFFCSCISLLQTARVTNLLITGQLALNFRVFMQFPSDQRVEQTVSLWVSSFGSFVRLWCFASDVLRNLCFSHCKRSLKCFLSLNLPFFKIKFSILRGCWHVRFFVRVKPSGHNLNFPRSACFSSQGYKKWFGNVNCVVNCYYIYDFKMLLHL